MKFWLRQCPYSEFIASVVLRLVVSLFAGKRLVIKYCSEYAFFSFSKAAFIYLSIRVIFSAVLTFRGHAVIVEFMLIKLRKRLNFAAFRTWFCSRIIAGHSLLSSSCDTGMGALSRPLAVNNSTNRSTLYHG